MRPTVLELVDRLLVEQKSQLRWAEQHFETIEDGHFSAIAINDDECVLAPYPEFSAIVYRGQSQYHEPALPSLYRNSLSTVEIMVERIRVAEFELLLHGHPAIADFNSVRIMGLRLRVDYEGLAQHYHLKTELLDFTTNPLVATFFACCEYDNNIHKYQPIMDAKNDGVFYTLNAALDISDEQEPFSSIVGLQPLSRPGDQYAWGYRLAKGASLNARQFVTTIHFAHDAKASKKIFEYFDGGAKLFPYDPVTEKAKEIAQTSKLSKQAFQLAKLRYGQDKDEQSLLADLTRKGLEIVDTQHIAFTFAEKAQIEIHWKSRKSDFLSRIHWKRALYPPY
jgi:hypothetical protein